MLLLSLLSPLASPKADFDRCVDVLRKAAAYAVRVHAVTSAKGTTVSTSATLAVRSKQWVSLNVSTPAEGGHGPLDWVCEVRGRTLRAYDTKRRAYIQQTFAKPLPAATGLTAQFGTMIPDAITRFMSTDQLDQFFAKFVGLTGWSRTQSGDMLKWTYKNASGTVTFGFSQHSGRLTDWKITGGSSTTWKLTYPDIAALPSLKVPGDAVLVDAFRLPPARPKIADRDARETVDRCFDAYENAFRFRATVLVEGARYDLWRDGGSVEEIGPSGGWRWSHGALAIWPKSGGVLTGETKSSLVWRYLSQLHINAEPLALTVLRDDNYAGTLFTPDYTVKKVGSVTVHGDHEALLQVAGPAVRFDLNINAKGLIRRIDSTAYDRAGRRMTETIRQISYSASGTPTPTPKGRRSPLPKLKALPKPDPLLPEVLRGGH